MSKLFQAFKFRLLWVLIAFTVSACSTHTMNIHRVTLDDNINYVLQPVPESLMNTGIQALFNVTELNVEQASSGKSFLMQVEMTPSNLLVSGLTVEGLSLFSLNWNTVLGTLDYDKKIPIEALRILAELQLVLWPLTDIKQGLQQGKVTVTPEGHREISTADDVIYKIKQQGNISHLTNLHQHYSIEIEELERWKINP